MFGMGHVRANYSLGLVESDLGRIVVRLRAYKVLLVSHVRLDWILFVSRLGFLLRTVRRRPISSTLPILLDRNWECDQDCFLGALLRIL